jgi:CTD small phosphatase-like protein 2
LLFLCLFINIIRPTIDASYNKKNNQSANNSSSNQHHNNHTSDYTPSKTLFSPLLRRTKSEEEMLLSNSQSSIQLSVTHESNEDNVKATLEEEEEENAFNPYFFMALLPEYSTVMIKDKICLPPISNEIINRPTLVLDLDETLVHCTVEPIENPDLIFPVA